MPNVNVNVPGLGLIPFPKGTPPDEMEKAIKDLLAQEIEQQGQARTQVAEVGRTPEMADIQRQAGTEARSMLGNAAINVAPSLAASAATATPVGLTGLGIRAGAQGGAELIRQAIQGEKIDPTAALTAAGFSGLVEGGSKAVQSLGRSIIKRAPGVQERISESMIPETQQMLIKNNLTLDKAGVEAAYNSVKQMSQTLGTTSVPLTSTKPMLTSLITELERRPAAEAQPAILSRLKKLQKGTATTPNIDELPELMADINAAISSTKSANGKRILIETKQALWQDLEHSPVPQAQKDAFRNAVRLAREAFAKGDLAEAIFPAKPTIGSNTMVNIINPKQVLERIGELKSDKLFMGSFKPGEIDKVEKFFIEMGRRLSVGSSSGQGIFLGLLGGATGGTLGAMAGPVGAGAGGTLGAMAGVSLPNILTTIAKNDKASKLLLDMIGTGKPIAVPVLTAIANAVTAATTIPKALSGAMAGGMQQ